MGVQVHGGMGFVEDTGAAQFMRDVRIAAIYEGTNGIQAIDLVQRKLTLSSGEAVAREIADMRATLEEVRVVNAPAFTAMAAHLADALAAFERATAYMMAAVASGSADAFAGATPYLRLFGLARGGLSLATSALAAHKLAAAGDSDPELAGRVAIARFFAVNIASGAAGLECAVTQGAASVQDAAFALVA